MMLAAARGRENMERENIVPGDAPSPILTRSKKQVKKKSMHFDM